MNPGTVRAALLGTRGVPANYGAFELAADRIATLGGERAVDWTIYCPTAPGQPDEYGNARLIRMPHGARRSSALWFDIRCLRHAARQDFDVVFMLGYGAGLFLALPRLFGKAVVTNTNGFEYRRSKWPWYAKLYFRYAEAAAALSSTQLISDSRHIAAYYKRRYARRSSFVAYGTDSPAEDSLARSQSAFEAFLRVHRLEPRGYHVVAMRLEPENSIEAIVGAGLSTQVKKPILVIGPTTRFFERLIQRVPADHFGVRVGGPIYDRNLLFLLRRNACSYVHGHTVGGINPAILESLSTGTPVLARDTIYNREVLEDAGRYFDGRESLSSLLAEVEALSPEEWSAAARRVGARQRPEFTWPHVVAEYERIAGLFAHGSSPQETFA